MTTALHLADRFFLVGLDDRTGALRVEHRILGLGLAGALLGELVLSERLVLYRRRLVVAHRDPPPDPLAHAVLEQMWAEQAAPPGGAPVVHPIGTWLAFLARDSIARVGERLVRGNWVTRHERRGLTGRRVSWIPVDSNAVAQVGAGLGHQVQSQAPMTQQDALLVGLVEVAGLTGQVLWAETHTAHTYLAWLVSQLPEPLRLLVDETRTATSDAVLAHH